MQSRNVVLRHLVNLLVNHLKRTNLISPDFKVQIPLFYKTPCQSYKTILYKTHLQSVQIWTVYATTICQGQNYSLLLKSVKKSFIKYANAPTWEGASILQKVSWESDILFQERKLVKVIDKQIESNLFHVVNSREQTVRLSAILFQNRILSTDYHIASITILSTYSMSYCFINQSC